MKSGKEDRMAEQSELRKQAEQAFNEIKGQFPEAARKLSHYISAIKQHHIVAIGTNEAFAIRDEEDRIQCFKRKVYLSEEAGTLVQPVKGGPYVISAQGYEVINDAAGVCCVLPPHVLVDGQYQQNPYVYRDPNNRRIQAIYCRAIAFGFNSTGLPQVSDWTTVFDVPSYRLIDLLSKAKNYPQAFKLLPAEMEPDTKEGGTWARYPFDESTYLWVNTAHQEALQWFSQIINREKKALDFAQTFAKRNASKHFHGLQKAPGREWTLEVYSWRSTNGNILRWDQRQYEQLQQRVEDIAHGKGKTFALEDGGKGEVIEVKKGKDQMDENEFQAEMDPEEKAEEMQGEEAPEAAPEPPPEEAGADVLAQDESEPAAQDSQVMRQLGETARQFPDEYERACNELGLNPGDWCSEEQAQKIMTRINQMLDES
jgi:hypothetical protein